MTIFLSISMLVLEADLKVSMACSAFFLNETYSDLKHSRARWLFRAKLLPYLAVRLVFSVFLTPR